MAGKQKQKEHRRRRIFGCEGAWHITYKPAPKKVAETVKDAVTGQERQIQKQAPAGLDSPEVVFQSIVSLGEERVKSLRLVQKEQSSTVLRDDRMPTHILVIEADDDFYDEKVSAIESSPYFSERRILDMDEVRRQRWTNEKEQKAGERHAAIMYYAEILRISREEATAKVDEQMLLITEIFAEAKEELDKRELELAQTPPGARPKEEREAVATASLP